MKPVPFDIDPFANDPGHWGASLVNNTELMVACLDAAGAKSVIEVGAYAGDLTGMLLQWAERAEATVGAVDPVPQPELVQLAEEHSQLDLVRETSLDALPHIDVPDAVVIDGDHNYWTVSEELRLIGERVADGPLPLLLFHDVCWPHARRDDYYDPAQIPEDFRQPIVEGGGLFPTEPGIRPGGLPYRWPAAQEGGPRNGVLTAIEDFVQARGGMRLAVVPAFFGLGIAWSLDAPYAGALAEILDPWDRNPVLERLEANRAFHLASVHAQMVEAAKASQRAARMEELLRRMLQSNIFALAERVSRIRHRGEPFFSRDDVRRAIAPN